MYVLGIDIGKTTGIAFVNDNVRDMNRQFYNMITPKWEFPYWWINERHAQNFGDMIEDGFQKCDQQVRLIVAEMPAIHFGYRHQAIYLAAQRKLEEIAADKNIPLRYITPGVWKNTWIKTIQLRRELGIHVRDATQIALWAIFFPKMKGSTGSAPEFTGHSLVVRTRKEIEK